MCSEIHKTRKNRNFVTTKSHPSLKCRALINNRNHFRISLVEDTFLIKKVYFD